MTDTHPIVLPSSEIPNEQFISAQQKPIQGLDLTWRVCYLGENGEPTGEVFLQRNSDGTENKYGDIDRSRELRFDLLKGDHPVCSVFCRGTQQLIYRRRTLIPMHLPFNVVIYLVGWRDKVYTPAGQKNIESIMYVYPDGSVALDGARDNLQLFPQEL